LRLDGVEQTQDFIPLVDDHVSHEVEIQLNQSSDVPASVIVSSP
jgi:hypothetical protein